MVKLSDDEVLDLIKSENITMPDIIDRFEDRFRSRLHTRSAVQKIITKLNNLKKIKCIKKIKNSGSGRHKTNVWGII